MAKFVVISPVRIQKAKIIPAEQVKIKRTKYKLPLISTSDEFMEDFASQEAEKIIDSDIQELEKKEKEEAKLLELSLVKPILKETFSISNLDIPVRISLEKIPKYKLPIEEVEKQVQEAYDKGYKDGHQIATATLQGEIETNQKWIRRIDEVVFDFKKKYIKEIKQLQELLPQLATTIAKHILNREASLNTNLVIEQTKKAIASLDDEYIFKILLNPEDVEILKQAKSLLMHDSSALEKVIIAADDTVEKGFCLLETSTGKIDSRLQTQLEKIKNKLDEEIEEMESDLELMIEDTKEDIEEQNRIDDDDNQQNK